MRYCFSFEPRAIYGFPHHKRRNALFAKTAWFPSRVGMIRCSELLRYSIGRYSIQSDGTGISVCHIFVIFCMETGTIGFRYGDINRVLHINPPTVRHHSHIAFRKHIVPVVQPLRWSRISVISALVVWHISGTRCHGSGMAPKRYGALRRSGVPAVRRPARCRKLPFFTGVAEYDEHLDTYSSKIIMTAF